MCYLLKRSKVHTLLAAENFNQGERVEMIREKKGQKETTYNSRCSPVVTHLTTNLPLIGLTLGERTGSRIFQWIWSYVMVSQGQPVHTASPSQRWGVLKCSFRVQSTDNHPGRPDMIQTAEA
ncbi:hypothetical protein V8C42DRAFT_313348 [Trichoderma barbatum]